MLALARNAQPLVTVLSAAAVAAQPTAAAAAVDAPPRPSRAGLALAAGVGYQTASLGLQAVYYVPVAPDLELQLSPYAGFGMAPIDDEAEVWLPGACAGLSASWGDRHRILADVGYGRVGFLYLDLHGTTISGHSLYGAQGGVGYEFVGTGGFVVRFVPVGFGHVVDPRYGTYGMGFMYNLNLSLGWKIW